MIMRKNKMQAGKKVISVLAAMLLAVLFVLPVQAAPKNSKSTYEAVFDSTYYANNNPDLKAAYGNDSSSLLNHFITYGMAEGRQGNAEFNVQYYKAAYADLQAVFGDNLKDYYLHYINYGKAEGRVGNGTAPKAKPTGNADMAPDNNNSANTDVNAEINSNPAAENQPEGTEGYVYRVIELVNQVRAENGLGSVSATSELMNTAQVRAAETITSFSHTRPDGSSCFTAFSQNGVQYRTAGENIAAGQPTPESVMESWMNSPGHRANILNSAFNHIGVGYCKAGSGSWSSYWVQCFTN